MSDENPTTEEEGKPVFKLSDDAIAIVRELVQLSFLTGTNIVDHLRAVLVEADEETGKLVPTENYMIAYNNMVQDLNEQAKAAASAADGSGVPAEAEEEVN